MTLIIFACLFSYAFNLNNISWWFYSTNLIKISNLASLAILKKFIPRYRVLLRACCVIHVSKSFVRDFPPLPMHTKANSNHSFFFSKILKKYLYKTKGYPTKYTSQLIRMSFLIICVGSSFLNTCSSYIHRILFTQ